MVRDLDIAGACVAGRQAVGAEMRRAMRLRRLVRAAALQEGGCWLSFTHCSNVVCPNAGGYGTRGEPSELWGGETRGDTNGRKNARVPFVGAGWRAVVGVF